MTPQEPFMEAAGPPAPATNQEHLIAADAPAAIAYRADLVNHLQRQDLATNAAVADALRMVPRHLFLPDEPLDRAYADEAIVTKWSADRMPLSSASQPAMVAIMLEQLAVQPGMRVLEIGAGTGYNAALLAELVGPHGHVTTIDIDPDTVAAARQHLASAGIGPNRVHVICGDGALGWPSGAPYDRIILTVGAWDVAPEWVRQLTPQGRLVLPLALHTVQLSVALDRQGETLLSASMRPCGFMRLRGPFAGPERLIELPATTGMKLLAEPPFAGTERLAALLTTPPRLRPLNVLNVELLRYTLAFMGQAVVTLFTTPAHPQLGTNTVGVIMPEGDAACFLGIDASRERHVPVLVEFGAATATQRVEKTLGLWRQMGKPALNQWQLRLHPPGGFVAAARSHAFIFPKGDWIAELSAM